MRQIFEIIGFAKQSNYPLEPAPSAPALNAPQLQGVLEDMESDCEFQVREITKNEGTTFCTVCNGFGAVLRSDNGGDHLRKCDVCDVFPTDDQAWQHLNPAVHMRLFE